MDNREHFLPASGRRARLLDELLRMAKALPKIIDLERSGVRDGNGYWQGSDAFGGTILNLHGLWSEINCLDLDAAALDDEPPF